jgi:hypothetical protein
MCKRCGKNCKRVHCEFGTGNKECQFCDICNSNDHHECDCPNICMEFYAGCRNPKIGNSAHCIYCQALYYATNCAGVYGKVCGGVFSEKYPPESTSFEIKYGHQFTMSYCFTCTLKIKYKKAILNWRRIVLKASSNKTSNL